jgi:hypothetical protein
MNEHNGRMALMLAEHAPAAQDLAFEIAVMAKIEQRRFVRGMALNLAAALLAAVLLALLSPQLALIPALTASWSSELSALTGNFLLMAALLIAAFAAWYFRPMEV